MRKLRTIEKDLIKCLLRNSNLPNFDLDSLSVEEMSDGGMGSLYFVSTNKSQDERNYGRCISERQFMDSDGTPILVSLNLDKEENLYEMDIWKVDFSPTIKFPECEN